MTAVDIQDVSFAYGKMPFIEEPIPDDVVENEAALRKRLLESFAAMRPFNAYLNEALEGFDMPKR